MTRTCELCQHIEEELLEKIRTLEAQRDAAVRHIAEWCVAIDVNGSEWDDWDEYYKDAMRDDRKCLPEIRDLLKIEIELAHKRREGRYINE